MEAHGCVFIAVVTDALVLKHQSFSIHSADNNTLYWTSSMQKYRIYKE